MQRICLGTGTVDDRQPGGSGFEDRHNGAARQEYFCQRQMLAELVAALTRRAPEALDPIFLPAWDAAPDDAARLRVVIDQVASLTDAQAHSWHSWHTGRHN